MKSAITRYANEKKKPLQSLDEVVNQYAYLIKYNSQRMLARLSSYVEYDDLFSAGSLGLIDAYKKFDPDRGIDFKTYANTRIRGAILDEVRSRNWVPRSIYDKSKTIERAFMTLDEQFGRTPTDEEMAAHLNISLKAYHKILNEIKPISVINFEEYTEVSGDIAETNMQANPFVSAGQNEIREILKENIKLLSKKEGMVLHFYYFEQMTFKEISVAMKVTESYICQLHTKAITKLRAKLRRILADE